MGKSINLDYHVITEELFSSKDYPNININILILEITSQICKVLLKELYNISEAIYIHLSS